MTDTATFRKWCRWLQRHFPLRTPYRVVLGMPANEPASHEGLCDLSNFPQRLTIYVRPTLASSHTANVLIHEWSHAYRADRIPELGTVDDEGALHATIERLIGNKWDQLRGDHAKSQNESA
jgi:hypothetical protein